MEHVGLAAGLRVIRPHDMRHTFAAQLACKGVTLKKIAELLGHKSTEVTERYAHLSPESLADAVMLLEPEADQAGAGTKLVQTKVVHPDDKP